MSGEPAVLRELVSEWPAVAAARRSPGDLIAYLRQLDSGAPVDAIMTAPEIEGRIFYRDALNGFNFVRNRLPLTAIAERALRYAGHARAPAVAVQSAPLGECLPGFAAANPLPLAHPSAQPRIWLGNAVTTPTHLDEWFNVGCVVLGRRRFTLFPPAQIANLYVGPLDYAPTGAPMSLVQLHAPDFARFPRFREALAQARSAELGPGDAMFIPPLWWHNVESLDPLNVLVNYWWHASGAPLGSVSGYDSLLHAIRVHRARVVVMDITGVATVDSKVANHLIQTVEAAALMGASVIVTGVSAEVAQSLVTLGVDLGRIRTLGDLQGGLEEAERILGYSVVRGAGSFEPA